MAEFARNPDVERRINDHLEAIDRALSAKGVPLTERRSVTGDVEAQIRDMLAASADGSPTAQDVEAVLGKIDAPESYAEDAEGAPIEQLPAAEPTTARSSVRRARFLTTLAILVAAVIAGFALKIAFIWGLSLLAIAVTLIRFVLDDRGSGRPVSRGSHGGIPAVEQPSSPLGIVAPRFSRAAIIGAAWAPLVVVLLGLFIGRVRVVSQVLGQPPPGPSALRVAGWITLVPLGLLAPFGATILGWVAVSQIRRSKGRLCGLGLAVTDGLLFPLLMLDVLIYLFWRVAVAVAISWKAWGIGALGRPSYSQADQNPMLIFVLAAFTALVVDWLIARWAWRRARTPIQP